MSPEGPKPEDGIFDPSTHGKWGDDEAWERAWTMRSSPLESGEGPPPATVESIELQEGE